MNRFAFIGVVSSVFLISANCSQQGPGSGQQGGSGGSSTGAGGASGSGGTKNDSGGASGSGGTTSSGGTTTSSGGTTTSGGSGGSAGSGGTTTASGGTKASGGTVSSGGAAGSGGSNAGGTTSKGGTTGAGGAATGGAATGGTSATGGTKSTGGTTGSGGTTTATGGTTTSAGGTTGAGGSSGTINAADVVPDLVPGFYWEDTCQENFDPGGHNCWTDAQSTTCPSAGISVDKTLNVTGTSGTKYTVNIEVAGVIGTRCYQGGKPASTAAISDSGYNNWWYAGGTPYNSTGWWNTYELHVSPSTGDASGDVYYFNSSSQTLASGGDCEREASYLVKYNASFKVVGGGTMLFRIHDNNCKAQQNCGSNTDSTSTCAPRTVDFSGVSPVPSGTVPAAKQPPSNTGTKTYYPQWMWITAASVTSP